MRETLKAISTLMLIGVTGIHTAALAEERVPTLSVSGVGRISVEPDMATISMGVTAADRNASDALRKTSVVMQKIFDLLEAAEIAPEDIQTSRVNLVPEWRRDKGSISNNSEPRIVGYRSENSLQVRVRDLSGLGRVLDAVSTVGANRITAITFGLEDPEPVRDLAREEAVRDALDKARLYTGAAGIELGEILNISESGGAFPSPRNMALARMDVAEAAAVPVAAGELLIEARIHMEFELVQGE